MCCGRGNCSKGGRQLPCDSSLLGSAGHDKNHGSLEGRRDAPVRKKGAVYVRSDEGRWNRQRIGRSSAAVAIR